MPELRHLLVKTANGGVVEAELQIDSSQTIKLKTGNNTGRKDSIFLNNQKVISQNRPSIMNNIVQANHHGIINNGTNNSSFVQLASDLSNDILAMKTVLASVELADTTHKHLFIVNFRYKDHAHNLPLPRNSHRLRHSSVHIKPNVFDVSQNLKPASGNEQPSVKYRQVKKGLLSTEFFVNQDNDLESEPVDQSIEIVRQSLLKRQNKSFCLLTFLLCFLSIVGSLAVTGFFLQTIQKMYSNLGDSVIKKNEFLSFYKSSWDIVSPIMRTQTAFNSDPIDYTDFYLNQMLVP